MPRIVPAEHADNPVHTPGSMQAHRLDEEPGRATASLSGPHSIAKAESITEAGFASNEISTAPHPAASSRAKAKQRGLKKVFDFFSAFGDDSITENGTVTVETIHNFMQLLLWAHTDPYVVPVCDQLTEAAQAALHNDKSGLVLKLGDKQGFQRWAAFLKHTYRSREIADKLAETELLVNTLLVQQFFRLSYERKVFMSFSWRDYIIAQVLLQLAPLTIIAAHRFTGPQRYVTCMWNVRQTAMVKMNQLLRLLPDWLRDRLKTRAMLFILCITVPLWCMPYVCLFPWWYLHANQLNAQVITTFKDFFNLQDFRQEVGFYEAHVPFFVMQVLINGAAMKVAIKAGIQIDTCAALVRDLGPTSTTVVQQRDMDGNLVTWTTGSMLAAIQKLTSRCMRESVIVHSLKWSVFVVPFVLTVSNRAMRVYTVGNVWAQELPYGPAAAVLNIICLIGWLTIWWQEAVELAQFLVAHATRTEQVARLFSRGDAAHKGLPCLKNRQPASLVMWAKLRVYLQQPSVLQLRWMELFLVDHMAVATAIGVVFLVALYTGTLFAPSDGESSKDLQVALLFATLVFMFFIACCLLMVMTAVTVGKVYHGDLRRLYKEAFDTQCVIEHIKAVMQPHGRRRSSMHMRVSVPARSVSRLQLDTCQDACIELGPSELEEDLSVECIQAYMTVLEKLVQLLQASNEYVQLFGIPIDVRFRNALFSIMITGMLAIMSSLVAVIAKQGSLKNNA